MKKQLFLISAAALTAASLYAASARLDFFNKAGEFFSVLESDLVKLIYVQADENDPESGFDKLKIETAAGERVVDLSDCAQIKYSPATGEEPFAIEVRDDGHCTVTLLDCMNNDGVIDPTKPDDWRGSESDGLGHFIYAPEYGYEMQVDITGQWTDKVYTEEEGFVFFVSAENYAGWTDSWGFLMPNEPIYIDGKSTELTTYAGRDFVGEYTGYAILNEPALDKPQETVFSLELRANGSYVVKTTDDNAYDFHYMYTYDSERDAIQHVEVEQPKWDNYNHYYGASGPFLGDDFIFVSTFDYTTNKLSDKRFYLAAKGKFTQTCAAGEFGNEHLIQAVTESGKVKYIYISNYGNVVNLAELQYIKGSNIGEECEAIVSYDGETRLKFTNDGNGNPQFIAKGLEAGSYVPDDDIAGDALVLDGFGGATIGDETHTYIVESGVVTLDGDGRVFNIDTTGKTYQEIFQNDEWTGPVEFSIGDALGAYGSTESEKCQISLNFGQDLNGNEKEGYAALTIRLWDSSYGTLRSAISSNPKFLYNKDKGIIILSGVLVGTGSGYTTQRRNLVLTVADDLQSMWFDESTNGPKIYGTGAPTDYIYTGTRNTLKAPAAAPSVSGTYTATFPQVYSFGSTMSYPVNITIAIDKGYSNVDKPGYAYIKADMNILNDVVEYEVTDSKFILKSIDVGDGNGTWSATDLEFEITSEGNLKGSGIVYGNQASTCFYGVDLGAAEFTPLATD